MIVTAAVDAGSIRQRAYELWERDGRPEAQEIDYWLRAEVELVAKGVSPIGMPVDDRHVSGLVDDPAQQTERLRHRTSA